MQVLFFTLVEKVPSSIVYLKAVCIGTPQQKTPEILQHQFCTITNSMNQKKIIVKIINMLISL